MLLSATKHKSQSVAPRGAQKRASRDTVDNSRAARTLLQIDRAFVELLHRRAYSSMRVSDITKKAGVGRATFYAHFSSKDELLRSQIVRIVLPMLVMRTEEPFLLDCRAFFAHIASAPHLYKALMGGPERSGARVIRESFEQHLEAALAAAAPLTERRLPLPLMKRFVISTLFAVVAHKLHTDRTATVEDMQRLFEKLAGSGLGR